MALRGTDPESYITEYTLVYEDYMTLRSASSKREFKLPWREAGPPNHHDDKVDSDE